MIPATIAAHLILLIQIVFCDPEIPTQTNTFSGYNYPKPSVPFNHGYVYSKPSCPLSLPSTSYITVPVTETSIVMTTLPPVTVTLPRLTEYFTETQFQISTTTSTDYLTSTTTEFQIQPTTVTSYITSTYCAPKTYLPPPPPQNTYLPAASTPPPPPPPTSSNTYLPVNPPQLPQQYFNVEQTTPNSFLQSFGFAQAAPIKRMANTIDDSSLESDHRDDDFDQSLTEKSVAVASSEQPPQLPAINIIYLEHAKGSERNTSKTGPPNDLVNWLLCRFKLVNMTCLN